MLNSPITPIKLKKARASEFTETDDVLAVEEPLQIKLEYTTGGQTIFKTIYITMRTPGNDEELAIGFLWTEGVIQTAT